MSTVELDDVASRALASLILSATADALSDDELIVGLAITRLEEESGLVLDVCAAILLATSALVGAGELDAANVFALSLAVEPDDDETLDGDDEPDADDDDLPNDHAHPLDDRSPTDAEREARADIALHADPPPIAVVALDDTEQGLLCSYCECAALGKVDNRPSCFWHFDHLPTEGRCPVCLHVTVTLGAEHDE